MFHIVGGLGAAKVGDETTAGILSQVKEQLTEKITTSKPHLTQNQEAFNPTPHSYKSQVVAGTNFFIKVLVGPGEFVHVRIYRDLSGNVQLVSIQEDKTEEDEISYF